LLCVVMILKGPASLGVLCRRRTLLRSRGETEVGGDAEQEHVEEGEGTDDEGDDDDDDDDIGQVQ
jgi:hypothetical protein